jgi:predicted nucleic acid-binding protein
MQPTLFDTTIWVDFINGVENRQTQLLEQTIRQQPDFVLLNPTILQEVLQGLRTEKDFNHIRNTLEAFPMLSPDWAEVSIQAAWLYFSLRKKGVTVRKSNDCLIAQTALYYDVLLVHRDSDFDLIARHTPLRTLL